MELEKKTKFKFSSSAKNTVQPNKETKLKEKENFSTEELKQYYNSFMTEYKSRLNIILS